MWNAKFPFKNFNEFHYQSLYTKNQTKQSKLFSPGYFCIRVPWYISKIFSLMWSTPDSLSVYLNDAVSRLVSDCIAIKYLIMLYTISDTCYCRSCMVHLWMFFKDIICFWSSYFPVRCECIEAVCFILKFIHLACIFHFGYCNGFLISICNIKITCIVWNLIKHANLLPFSFAYLELPVFALIPIPQVV